MKRDASVWQGSLRELELLDCLQYVRNSVRALLEYCRAQWGEEDVPFKEARRALVEIDRAAPELVRTDFFTGREEDPFAALDEEAPNGQ